VVVAVDIGAMLLVEVSHRTVEQMALAEGAAIWCLIKVNAVTYL
jgi:molybdopterin-binding protein